MNGAETPRGTHTLHRSEHSVAAVLGVDAEACVDLPPFVVGTEAVSSRGGSSRGTYLRRSAVDARLAPLQRDAEAGVPDAAIARHAGLTAERVRQWRRRHQIERHPGRPTRGVHFSFALSSLFGDGPPAIEHLTRSRVGGTWEVPNYVLREPLDYNAFVEVVVRLRAAGMHEETIARGIGVYPRDVKHAAALAGREAT